MVVIENRKNTKGEKEPKRHENSIAQKEIQSTVQIQENNCGPMVHRKIEVCNDVERNPGPKPGGNAAPTPINDNPRVSKIGIFNSDTSYLLQTRMFLIFKYMLNTKHANYKYIFVKKQNKIFKGSNRLCQS